VPSLFVAGIRNIGRADKEGLLVAVGAVDEIRRGSDELLIDRFHAFLVSGPVSSHFCLAPPTDFFDTLCRCSLADPAVARTCVGFLMSRCSP